MSLAGLTLPFLSDADPDTEREGSIDPMGLAPVSDRLAAYLAPDVASRMSRIRFLTAIAACALACDGLEEIPPADGVTPPYLAAEWCILEGFARRLKPSETLGIPGIVKARTVIAHGGRLDHRSYLKAAKVFGFHGVYKRLARSLDLVDTELLPGASVDELLRIWEREQRVPGFVDMTPASEGRLVRKALTEFTVEALRGGHAAVPPSSGYLGAFMRIFRPDREGRRESRWLWQRLLDDMHPVRRELLLSLANVRDESMTDRAALMTVRPDASPELRGLIDAVDAFERAGVALTTAFDVVRFASTGEGWIGPAALQRNPSIRAIAETIGPETQRAVDEIALVDPEIASLYDRTFGGFISVQRPDHFLETLLEHHDRIQREKDNRAWYESSSAGILVRPGFHLYEEPEVREEFGRPYRIQALMSFARDVA